MGFSYLPRLYVFSIGCRLAEKFGLEEYLTRVGAVDNMSFSLDDALPVVGKPVEGSSNRRQVIEFLGSRLANGLDAFQLFGD